MPYLYEVPCEYKWIKYEVEDRVATITLNRPERMNALSWELLEQWYHAMKVAERDDDVGVIRIRGAGRCFATGYDMTPGQERKQPLWKPEESPTGFHRESMWNSKTHVITHQWYWIDGIWDCYKPVVAQVHGYCFMGAAEMALTCDLLFCSEDAVIGNPGVRAQNTGDMFGVIYWHIGLKRAKQIMFTGDCLRGPECVEWGIANACFPNDKLDEETLKICKKIAQTHPSLLMLSKFKVNFHYDMMGFRAAQRWDEYDTLGHFTDTGWDKVREEKGWKAATEYRDAPWGGILGRAFPPGPLYRVIKDGT